MGGRGQPGDLAAPVVAHQVEGLGAQSAGEIEDVGNEPGRCIGSDVARAHTGRVATLVGSDGVEPGRRERREHVPPREP